MSIPAPRSILQRSYPKTAGLDDEEQRAAEEIAQVRQLVGAIRRTRTELQISPGTQIPLQIKHWRAADRTWYEKYAVLIESLANAAAPKWLADTDAVQRSALAMHGSVQFLIPAEGLIDVRAEVRRLEKESAQMRKRLEGLRVQMSRPDFTGKAPAQVVEEKKRRANDLERRIDELGEQLKLLR